MQGSNIVEYLWRNVYPNCVCQYRRCLFIRLQSPLSACVHTCLGLENHVVHTIQILSTWGHTYMYICTHVHVIHIHVLYTCIFMYHKHTVMLFSSRMPASSIHASTSSGNCSVTFFKYTYRECMGWRGRTGSCTPTASLWIECTFFSMGKWGSQKEGKENI